MSQASNPSPPRVVWTDAEKHLMVDSAAEIQRDHPELAGLPLLREAMRSLPPERRRRLIAVTQAPWFESGLRARTKKTPPGSGRIIRAIATSTEEATQAREAIIAMLALIHAELRTLNAKLGQPVPVPTESPNGVPRTHTHTRGRT